MGCLPCVLVSHYTFASGSACHRFAPRPLQEFEGGLTKLAVDSLDKLKAALPKVCPSVHSCLHHASLAGRMQQQQQKGRRGHS